MYKCLFNFANNIEDYNKINKYYFLFSNKKYNEDCISLNRKVCLFDCFYYFYKKNIEFDYYIYFSKKSKILDENLFDDKNFYLDYYGDNILFLKYDKKIYKIFSLFEHNINENNFLNFLSDYYSSFNFIVNKNLGNKLVFPKNKLLYNSNNYEKFKYKTSKSL